MYEWGTCFDEDVRTVLLKSVFRSVGFYSCLDDCSRALNALKILKNGRVRAVLAEKSVFITSSGLKSSCY